MSSLYLFALLFAIFQVEKTNQEMPNVSHTYIIKIDWILYYRKSGIHLSFLFFSY